MSPQPITPSPLAAPFLKELSHYGNPLSHPPSSRFSPSTTIFHRGNPQRAPVVGLNPAQIVHHPLMLQEGAGRLFHYDLADPDNFENKTDFNPLLNKILKTGADASVFLALYGMHKDNQDNPQELRWERFLFVLACFKAGQLDTALNALQFFDSDSLTDSLSIYAAVVKADIYLAKAVTTDDSLRFQNLGHAYELMTEVIPRLFRSQPPLSQQNELKEVLSEVYYHIVGVFHNLHYPAYAVEISRTLTSVFPQTPATRCVLSPHSLLKDFVRDNKIQDQAQSSFTGMLWAGAKEFFHQAKFPHNKYFWQAAIGGGMVAMGLNSVFGSGGVEFAPALQAFALGAATAVTGAKTWLGFSAPETKQAWLSGYSPYSLRETFWTAAKESLKLGGTYALAGGVLPGLGHLTNWFEIPYLTKFPDVFFANVTANGSASLYGPGSIFAGLYTLFASQTWNLVTLTQTYGLWEGALTYLHNLRETTVMGSAFGNGIDYSLAAFDWLFSGMPADALKLAKESFSFSFSDPTSAGLAALKSYALVSGLYAFTMMFRPSIREGLLRKFGVYLPKLEIAMIPGAHAFIAGVGMATGVEPLHAWTIPFAGYMPQIRHIIQSGWRGGVTSFHWASLMGSGAAPMLYAGPGAVMRSDISPHSLMDYYGEHMGMGPFLIQIGAVHAIVTGLDVSRIFAAKYAKHPFYEAIGNFFKLFLGWKTFGAVMIANGIKELSLGATVSNSFRESGGSPIQYANIQGDFLEISKEAAKKAGSDAPMPKIDIISEEKNTKRQLRWAAKNFEELYERAAQNGKGWEFWKDLYLNSSHERKFLLIPLLYYVQPRKDSHLTPRPQTRDYRAIIYRILTDKNTNPSLIVDFLNQLKVIAKDDRPELYDVRHSLILTLWAASQTGPHQNILKNFFDEGRWILNSYDLTDDNKKYPKPPPPSWKSFKAKWWFSQYLSGGLTKQQRAIQNLEDGVAVAGRRWHYSNPLIGETIVQIMTPFYAFFSSASSSDPAFQTTPDHRFFKNTIFKLLLNPKTSDQEIEGLLIFAKEFLSKIDYPRRDLQYNFLITLSAAVQPAGFTSTPHQGKIAVFLNEHKWLYGYYGIDQKAVASPPKSFRGRYAYKWFKNRLISSNTTASGIVREEVYPL